jgi:galactokinase/mevalonate kinase-like predicted kinase
MIPATHIYIREDIKKKAKKMAEKKQMKLSAWIVQAIIEKLLREEFLENPNKGSGYTGGGGGGFSLFFDTREFSKKESTKATNPQA